MPRCVASTRCRPPRGLGAADTHLSCVRRFTGLGAGEVAIVAWALVGMPAQTRRLCAAGRTVSILRRGSLVSGAWNTTSASCWPTSSGTRERWSITPPGAGMANHLDRVRGEFGQRDYCQTHEQEAADALEQGNGATLPRRANNGAERYARGRLPSSLSRLPPCKRRRGNRIGGVMNPTGLHALGAARSFSRRRLQNLAASSKTDRMALYRYVSADGTCSARTTR